MSVRARWEVTTGERRAVTTAAVSSLFPLAGQSVEYGPVRRLTWRAVTTAAVSSLFPLAGQSVEYGPVRRLA